MPRLSYNDERHLYRIDGKSATGVSTVAKAFQDTYNLERKSKRDVAKGMARRPDLCSIVVALGDDETWDTKKKIDKAATDAIEASGAWAKANLGTAKHTILERVHKGLPLDDVFDDRLLAYADAYRELLEGTQLEPFAGLTERFVVYPEQMIAGRLDCAYIDHDGYLLLGDFKSGARAVQYPHSIVAQLGLYLNAPYLYNEATDEFDPAPEWGDTIIVAHVPDDVEQFALWTIDAELARTVALAALERHRYIKSEADTLVRPWRSEWTKTAIAVSSLSPQKPPATSTPPTTSSPNSPASSPTPTSPSSVSSETTSSPPSTDPTDRADPMRRDWIIGRLEKLRTIDGALSRVGFLWPSGLATLKNSDRHTDADLDRIVTVLDTVEAEFVVDFETPDPTKEVLPGRWTPTDGSEYAVHSPTPAPTSPPTSSKTTLTKCSTDLVSPETISAGSLPSSNSTVDEGGPADPAAVAILEKAYDALAQSQGRSWIAGIARDAMKNGKPIHLQGAATIRRFEIVRGLVALAAHRYDEDEIVRAIVGAAVTVADSCAMPVHVWDLNSREARTFAHMCIDFCEGRIIPKVDVDGQLWFHKHTANTTKGQGQ